MENEILDIGKEVSKITGELRARRRDNEARQLHVDFVLALNEADRMYSLTPTLKNSRLTLIDIVGVNNYLNEYVPVAIDSHYNHMRNWLESARTKYPANSSRRECATVVK